MNFDVIVIGSGPGGYVAAIRAAQLGFSTAVVERSEIGGVCLNWGCIPTKALLKSASVYRSLKEAASYGVKVQGEVSADLEAMVARSRGVADTMNKGISFLFKKNKVTLIEGMARIKPGRCVSVISPNGQMQDYQAKYIILATGARARELPSLKQDGEKVITYRTAMTLEKQPQSMLIVGSGAIGSEFAYFYQSIGTEVTLVEYLPSIVPVEDADTSAQLSRSFRKMGMKVLTEASVEKVEQIDGMCHCTVQTKKGPQEIQAEIVLSAVGITPNIEYMGLEEVGIAMDRGKIVVDASYQTNMEGYYAIGDIVPGPALAHVASHEALICVERLAGLQVPDLDYDNIPGCTYTGPEIASVGMTEKKALEAGYELKIGKFPFTASGKATAAGHRDGFIKVIFDAQTNLMLGCHMIGDHVTEMIAEAVIIRQKQMTAHEIISAVHPHPTMSEALMEAVAVAYNQAVHI